MQATARSLHGLPDFKRPVKFFAHGVFRRCYAPCADMGHAGADPAFPSNKILLFISFFSSLLSPRKRGEMRGCGIGMPTDTADDRLLQQDRFSGSTPDGPLF